MRWTVALLFTPSLALAAPSLEALSPSDTDVAFDSDVFLPEAWAPDVDAQVVGGEEAPLGKWPDAVYVTTNNSACTGTLIHPRVVLTAAHCGPGMNEVLLGAVDKNAGSLGDPSSVGGEVRRVAAEYLHEGYGATGGNDIAVLVLEEASTITPRRIGSGCIAEEDLVDGAEVQVVGWGNTRAEGVGSTDVQREGTTVVQTADCSVAEVPAYSASGTSTQQIMTGCTTVGTEVGAGGNGVDACFGDSGGPLYLETERGTYVVGVTSRAYTGAPGNQPCLHGGIYTRPDAYVEWIEAKAGLVIDGFSLTPPTCNFPPDVTAESLRVRTGGRGRGSLTLDDADGGSYVYEVVRPPVHGSVEVDEDGTYVYLADRGVKGVDSFLLRVLDYGTGDHASDVPAVTEIEVPVELGQAGCATTPVRPLAWLSLVGFGAAVIRRRQGRASAGTLG